MQKNEKKYNEKERRSVEGEVSQEKRRGGRTLLPQRK